MVVIRFTIDTEEATSSLLELQQPLPPLFPHEISDNIELHMNGDLLLIR